MTTIRVRAVVVGNNTLDHVYVLDRPVQLGEKHDAGRMLTVPGGPGANVAVALAGLGVETLFVGAFGEDDAATLSETSLVNAGVDVSHVVRAACRHHTATVIVDGVGNRTIVEHRMPDLIVSASASAAISLAGIGAVYSDGRQPEAARELFARAAHERPDALRVSDLEVLDGDAVSVIRLVDELVAPGSALAALAESPAAVTALGPSVVVATGGETGAVVTRADGASVLVPATPVATVVDSTGAGDAFHAGYLVARLAGRTPEESAAFGCIVGAAKCSVVGPRLDISTLAALRRSVDW